MTLVRVLKAFPLYHNGATRMVDAGVELDLGEDLLPGLAAANLVQPLTDEDDNPFGAPEDEPARQEIERRPRGRPRRENKDAGSRSRRS